MILYILGGIILIISLFGGGLALVANGMSDNPSEQVSYWLFWVGLVIAIACFVTAHYN